MSSPFAIASIHRLTLDVSRVVACALDSSTLPNFDLRSLGPQLAHSTVHMVHLVTIARLAHTTFDAFRSVCPVLHLQHTQVSLVSSISFLDGF